MENNNIILYQTENSDVVVNVIYKDETFWLTQKAMAELFGVKSQAVTKHLQNIYQEEELSENPTCSKMEQVQNEGGRSVKRVLDFYNMIKTAKRLNNFMLLCRINFIMR